MDGNDVNANGYVITENDVNASDLSDDEHDDYVHVTNGYDDASDDANDDVNDFQNDRD